VILIVDDDPEIRFMLRLWLEELGNAFDEVASGEEALEKCAEQRYRAIVLDQRMPLGMSGIETATALRERKYEGPIILHSAYLNEEVEADAAQLGLPTVEKGDERGLLAAVQAAITRE